MDITFITDLYIPGIVAATLILGYILKKWIRDMDNKYIPTLVCLTGAVLGCMASQSITVNALVAGAVSGLASTGLHQAFKQIIENPKKLP